MTLASVGHDLSARDALFDSMSCSAASIEGPPQSGSIYPIVCADSDDLGPRFSVTPLVPDRDIHPLADDLKDDLSARFFGGMDQAFASVHAGRQLARRFPQRFQGERLVRFVAPRSEDLRVIVRISMSVMPAIWTITVMGTVGLVG